MSLAAPSSTREVRSAHRFDEARLARYLQTQIPTFGRELQVRQFRGGQSNPTFWVSDGASEWVMRKKPPGPLLPSAHAVEREYRIMTALATTDVPVAKTVLLCEETDVIGTPFFLMEYVAGRIFWNVQLPDASPAERVAIYRELARVLAALHRIDYEGAGLSDYGKPGQYIARQVQRWSAQYEASRTDEIPSMEALRRFLPANVPTDDRTTLTHGDYRLDNIIFHPTEPRALAVIDWELSTLGHPLCDLAYTCMLYDVALPNVGGLLGIDFAAAGIPTEAEFIRDYTARSGLEVTDEWPYFKAFSLFRLAAIAQGVYKRSLQGNASSDNAAMFGAAVQHLSDIAARMVEVTTRGR